MNWIGFAPRGRALLIVSSLALTLVACQHRDIVVDAGDSMIASGGRTSTSVAGRNVAKRRSGPRNILVLTSGGADGAFGAGVLSGWSASGTRPQFDIVTGASTGALQATAAFLGSEFDGLLEELYTTTRTRDILRSNGLKTLFRTGRYDPMPLHHLLSESITEGMLDAVATQHNNGRRLYVATTDMTAGKTVIWDMGAIAAGGENRKDRYIDILVASAAAPGLIESVYVRNRQSGAISVHSDGGVKAPVPLEGFMLDESQAGATDVWVIANGHVSPSAAVRSEASSTLPLAQRGVTQLLRQLLYISIRDAEARTRQAGARFHLAPLPDTIPEAANPFEFNPEEMRGLFEAGREVGLRNFGMAGTPAW